MKISDSLKTHFFSIILTFIDDFTLNSDNYKRNLKFGLCWPLLAFIGLFLPLWPWINFLRKNWPFLIKIKHNWPVSNNRISKSISEGYLAFQITVLVGLSKFLLSLVWRWNTQKTIMQTGIDITISVDSLLSTHT